MDLDGTARYVIDQAGHFSQATDTRLTAAFSNNCSTYGINENSEALFNCGRFLVHYRADDAQDNPCPADVNNDSIISVMISLLFSSYGSLSTRVPTFRRTAV